MYVNDVGRTSSLPPVQVDPAPVQPGSVNYYQQRYDDFVARNPGVTPPDYYLEYGQKYADRFSSLDGRDLSPEGLAWRDRTLTALQQAMEDKRIQDPEGFAELERDPQAFREFAYDTHPDAYVDSGLFDLSAQDLAVIAATPDINDVLTEDGIAQTLLTLGKLSPSDIANIAGSTGKDYFEETGVLGATSLGPALAVGNEAQRLWERVGDQSWMPPGADWVIAPLPTLDNAVKDFDLPGPLPKDIPLVPFL